MHSPRTILLVALLFVELALVVSLQTLGWFGTGGAIRWIACLVATILPLGIAGMLLTGNRWRFSLRSLLTFTTLIAVFLCVSGMPLLDFHASRNTSKKLIAASTTLKINSSMDDFYTQLGFDPRPTSSQRPVAKLPPWLQPLVGNASAIPADHSVREIWLNSDVQIQILCDQPSRFESLERILMSPGVTHDGLVLLQKSLPRFQQVVDIQVSDVAVPKHWFASLRNVRTLSVWAVGPLRDSAISSSDLHDIASLPDLQVLMVMGCGLNDPDAKILTGSKSLKHIFFRRTAMTASGETAIADAMPNCIVHRN